VCGSSFSLKFLLLPLYNFRVMPSRDNVYCLYCFSYQKCPYSCYAISSYVCMPICWLAKEGLTLTHEMHIHWLWIIMFLQAFPCKWFFEAFCFPVHCELCDYESKSSWTRSITLLRVLPGIYHRELTDAMKVYFHPKRCSLFICL